MHQSLHKKEKVIFKYELRKTIDLKNVSFLVDDGHSNKKIIPNVVTIDKQSLLIEHQFESNGFYDVHLYIGDDIISTYTFGVK
jgi:hypothetical protein